VSGGAGDSGFHPAQNADLAARVVTIGSLSAYIPGWRMGWMAGSEMAGKLRAYKQSMTICSTSVSQWAALGLVETL
jgi:aspartate/methionine/tyrosine aminotransferase